MLIIHCHFSALLGIHILFVLSSFLMMEPNLSHVSVFTTSFSTPCLINNIYLFRSSIFWSYLRYSIPVSPGTLGCVLFGLSSFLPPKKLLVSSYLVGVTSCSSYEYQDQVSECQSFHSNHHLCSQPRKVSIGILMDSFSKDSGPKDVNAKDSIVPTDENLASGKTNSAEDGKRMVVVLHTATKGKQTEALVQETSPWLSTRSFNHKLPTSDQVHGAELTHILPTTGPITEIHNRLHVPRVPPANFSVHFFADHMSGLESSKASQRKFDADMSGTKDRTGEAVEKISFTTIRKIVPEKEVVEDKATNGETRGSETLRMKLWEILGTISSPNQHSPNDCDIGVGAKNMKLMQKNDREGNPVVKPRQNSDTIESDSEGHDCHVRRLRTRSLTRKATKSNDAQSTRYTKENRETNASFQQGFSARLRRTASGGSLAFKGNKSTGIKAHMMCSHVHESLGQDQQVKNMGERRPSVEKSTLHGNEVGDENESYKRRKYDFIDRKNVSLDIDPHQVHLRKMSEHLRNESPKLQKNVDLQEDVGYTFLKNISGQKFDIQSPTFGANTPKERSPDFPPSELRKHAQRSSPGSPPKTKLGEADNDSPAKTMSNTEGIQSFKNFLASKLPCDKADSQSNSSDDAGGLEDYFHMEPRPIVEEPGSRLSNTSSEGSDSETSKEGSHVKGFGESELLFPKLGSVKKPVFGLHLNKKHQYQETLQVSGFSPTLFSRKGNEDSTKLQQHQGLNQEDGLASAVSLFALALERVKSKMKSVVRKRSAEILMSAAEGIYAQLQTAESEIQADMGKLTSLNKSKRKRLEMRFQELQGQLNVIHTKFKEEVHQHVQDCRDTVEGLDAHQMEFRGTVEKQCASHRKLLLQAEEAIETQLNDAGRRITEVHNLVSKKMLQLKNVVADCLDEVTSVDMIATDVGG